MTSVGSVYGQALYSLAAEEAITQDIHTQLLQLKDVFLQVPEYLRLLSAANLPRQERCALVDELFRDKVHIYVLNFLKILTEKGYAKAFSDCVEAFTKQYNLDNHILPVWAVTAVPLTQTQIDRLEKKLSALTGENAQLHNKVDPQCVGGVLLDYDGTQVDGSVASRISSIRKLLKNTVL